MITTGSTTGWRDATGDEMDLKREAEILLRQWETPAKVYAWLVRGRLFGAQVEFATDREAAEHEPAIAGELEAQSVRKGKVLFLSYT